MAPHPIERAQTKSEWRGALLAQRQAMSEDDRREAAIAIGLHVESMPLIVGSSRVACYLSMDSEPSTRTIIDMLTSRGVEVIVPRVRGDAMDWVSLSASTEFATSHLGMREPLGDSTTLDGVGVILMPALAVDHQGTRLGRGGGYYDRALENVRIPRCALVFAHELVEMLPNDPHDIAVNVAVSPHGIFRVEA